MDPRVGDRNAAGGTDGLARADRPAVLDERDCGGGVVRDSLVQRPGLLPGREAASVGLDARRAEADQRADKAPALSASPAVRSEWCRRSTTPSAPL